MVNEKIVSSVLARIIFVSTGACLLMAINYCYQHYFHHAGKGVDDYLCAIAIWSLNMFFVTNAATRSSESQARFWLSSGFAYLILSSVFVAFEILAGQGIIFLVLIPSTMMVLLWLFTLLKMGDSDLYESLIRGLMLIFCFSTILTSLLFIYAILIMILQLFIDS